MGRTVKVKSKAGVVYPIHLYDTAAGAGDAGNGTDVLNVGSEYARMTTNLSGACGKDTPLRVKKGGNIYQVTQYGEYVVNPVSVFYAHDNNPNHNFAKRDFGWIGDGESGYYEVYWSDSGSNTNFNYLDVVIPRNCSVIRLEGYGGQTANNTINVKVTPGKTYRLVAWRTEESKTETYWYAHHEMDGGHSLGTTWYEKQKSYITHRCRQLRFAYPSYPSGKYIVLTNSDTSGSVTMGKKPYHTSKGTRYEDVIVGLNDAAWGNGGYAHICFGKGYYNYEANPVQDTML